MQRRDFIRTGAAAGAALTGTALGATGTAPGPAATKELIEWRVYQMAWGGNQGTLMDYLNQALAPALRRKGSTQFQVFKEYGQTEPAKIHVMISYADAEAYLAGQMLDDDAEYRSAAKAYDESPADRPVYARYESWLLNAFDGMPQSKATGEDAGLFELRVYEGYNEDATRRKIRMFNDHELTIFEETGLDAVFYGDMIAGPYRPCLVYLLQFDDMAARDENWAQFGSHPEWVRIKDLPEFANSVSNILRTLLVPA